MSEFENENDDSKMMWWSFTGVGISVRKDITGAELNDISGAELVEEVQSLREYIVKLNNYDRNPKNKIKNNIQIDVYSKNTNETYRLTRLYGKATWSENYAYTVSKYEVDTAPTALKALIDSSINSVRDACNILNEGTIDYEYPNAYVWSERKQKYYIIYAQIDTTKKAQTVDTTKKAQRVYPNEATGGGNAYKKRSSKKHSKKIKKKPRNKKSIGKNRIKIKK